MAFLNGTDVPDLLRLQTLITKFVGSIFSCAANLTVGTEGPLVHMGACIASVIAFWECGKSWSSSQSALVSGMPALGTPLFSPHPLLSPCREVYHVVGGGRERLM